MSAKATRTVYDDFDDVPPHLVAEVVRGADILVPDLAGWRRERLPPDWLDAPHFTLAPDWTCEVLSPRTATLDRAEKMPIYAREHVAWAWLVDPAARTLEAFALERGRRTQLGAWKEDDEARIEPFDAVPLALAALWAG